MIAGSLSNLLKLSPTKAAGCLTVLYLHGVDGITSAKGGYDVQALDRRSKDRVVAIEGVLGAEAKVELRSRRVGILRSCHGERPVNVAVARVGRILLMDGVAGPPVPGMPLGPILPAATSSGLMSRVLGQPP